VHSPMSLLQEYQDTQTDLQTAVDSRQTLDAQLTENEQVKKEFDSLKEHNTVFKLIGPVLIKQEQSEAKANVNTRIEFIKGELKRADARIKDLEAKAVKQRTELVQQQTKEQEQAAATPA